MWDIIARTGEEHYPSQVGWHEQVRVAVAEGGAPADLLRRHHSHNVVATGWFKYILLKIYGGMYFLPECYSDVLPARVHEHGGSLVEAGEVGTKTAGNRVQIEPIFEEVTHEFLTCIKRCFL